MNAEPNEIVSRHLHTRMAELTEQMRRDGTLTDPELVKIYLSLATTLACNHLGPAMAAEHLRDVADEIEHTLCGLH